MSNLIKVGEIIMDLSSIHNGNTEDTKTAGIYQVVMFNDSYGVELEVVNVEGYNLVLHMTEKDKAYLQGYVERKGLLEVTNLFMEENKCGIETALFEVLMTYLFSRFEE